MGSAGRPRSPGAPDGKGSGSRRGGGGGAAEGLMRARGSARKHRAKPALLRSLFLRRVKRSHPETSSLLSWLRAEPAQAKNSTAGFLRLTDILLAFLSGCQAHFPDREGESPEGPASGSGSAPSSPSRLRAVGSGALSRPQCCVSSLTKRSCVGCYRTVRVHRLHVHTNWSVPVHTHACFCTCTCMDALVHIHIKGQGMGLFKGLSERVYMCVYVCLCV